MSEVSSSSTLKFDMECQQIKKSFDDFIAVNNVSFKIPKGSFFSILGPSGCGKTTLLRMLAGFQPPDSGDIIIKDKSVLDTPPNKRPVNMVFQHLALFPTMNVYENIAYGLKRKGITKSEQKRKIDDVLDRVGLPDSGSKQISQLSGGQKQRIAIARCLVLEPDVLLLDEPLGALDLKLREQMKIELKRLQQLFGTTFIYITHDQSEALVMSDQVAVMNHGKFEQVGTPQELYYHPKTPFVASFVGENNRWTGKVLDVQGEQLKIETLSGQQLFGTNALPTESISIGDSISIFVRPESISMATKDDNDNLDNDKTERNQPDSKENSIDAKLVTILFDGARSHILVETISGDTLNVSLSQTGQHNSLKPGDALTLSWTDKQGLCFLTGSSLDNDLDETTADVTINRKSSTSQQAVGH